MKDESSNVPARASGGIWSFCAGGFVRHGITVTGTKLIRFDIIPPLGHADGQEDFFARFFSLACFRRASFCGSSFFDTVSRV